MGKFINHEAASAFLNGIDDPIVQSLPRSAYQTTLMTDAIVEGEFDPLYFLRIMEGSLRDRERLAKALMGDSTEEDETGWGS